MANEEAINNAKCWLRRIDYVVTGLEATRGEFKAVIDPATGDITIKPEQWVITASQIARHLGK